MDIQSEKLKLIKLLLNTDNPSVIESIRSIFFTEEVNDIWEEISSDQKTEIEDALKEVEQGEIVPLEQFLERHS